MRNAIALSLVLAACSYTPPADPLLGVDSVLPSDPNDPVDPLPDGPGDPDAPPQGTCTTSDSSLRLCLELEDSTSTAALDGSGQGHHAQVTGATATERDVPSVSRALQLGGTSAIMIGDTPDFDVQTLTISAWVKRSSAPTIGQRFGVVDVGSKQAALAIDSQGRVVCMVRTDFDVWVGTGFAATSVNEWSLVACTYDAPDLCMYTFKAGSSNPDVECGQTDGEPLDMSIDSGGTIGALFDNANQPTSKFAGSIDSIRVYSRALTETQLCTAGGLSGC
ncbi:MAG: LamG domain-containing protein [Deltaproteobacteria bacterium]|nr:LamG domain-containing protein [Deltaproteobacteria bacterium]